MVVVEIDTGFVGGNHTVDAGLTTEEFAELTDDEKTELLSDCVWEKISASFRDDETDEYIN